MTEEEFNAEFMCSEREDCSIFEFESISDRNAFWKYLKSNYGWEEDCSQKDFQTGKWGVIDYGAGTLMSFKKYEDLEQYVLSYEFTHFDYSEYVQFVLDENVKPKDKGINCIVSVPVPVEHIVTAIVENKIENEVIKKDDPMSIKAVKFDKTKQLQIDAAKIAAKIEIGKVANTQITKRIMKQIDLPPFLVGYKKQIEPVIRLLVANGALIAADSMGVDNKKAQFIMEAMQLAGTQEVLGLINLDETIDTLVGMIDPKLMVRAGAEDSEADITE